MRVRKRRFTPLPLAAALGAGMAHAATPPRPATRLTLERVARHPPPGSRIPGSFRFTHDGRYLYYLHAQGPGGPLSLFREEVRGGRRELVARPPGGGCASGPEGEAGLARQRRRIRDTGITGYTLAERADAVAFACDGDLYLARPGRDPLKLTGSATAAARTPRLSPDGRRLAFVRGGELHVLDIAAGTESRLTSGARDGLSHGVAEYIAQEEMDRHVGFWWSPDGARLAFAEVDETDVPIYPIVHQAGPAWSIENHRYPFAGGPNARVRIGIIPSTGGRTRWVDPGTWSGGDYLARVAWSPDSSLLVQTQSRDQRILRLLRVDPESGEWTVLIEERSESWINLHEDLRPLEDGSFIWSSESSGFRHLELRRADGSLLRALTSGDWGVDALAGLDADGHVLFTAAREGPLQRQLYRVGLDARGLSRLSPEPGFHTVTVSPDGRSLVDVHDSASSAPRVLLKETSGRTIRPLTPREDPEVAALGLRPPELVTIRADDGTPLNGALYLPRDAKPDSAHPAVIRVYGGPGRQTVIDSWEVTRDLRAQYLAERGYVVFRLDNRGTPRRGRAFETAMRGRLGTVEVEDQLAGARYVAGLPYVDGKRIGIYGWSYGGYLAALCLLKAPEIFRAAVVGAPVTDWSGYDTHYTERYMGMPRDNPDGYRRGSILPLVPRLHGQLLIIHGMLDENVHFRHTARLLAALNAAGKKYDLLILPDARHMIVDERVRLNIEARIVEHFDRALGPP
ncbi:MAG: S9 family peptidase [Acidobacteriota bacterium]